MMESKSDVNTTISYSGNVSITVKKGGAVVKELNVKNNGTTHLFHGIALALSGDVNKYVPKYLGVGSDGGETTSTSLISQIGGRVGVVSLSPYNADNGWVAPFQAVISYRDVKSVPIKEIGLFYDSESIDSMLARVVIDDSDGVELSQGESIIISWKMGVKNYREEVVNE